MESLQEDAEEDDEILSLTNEGVSVNKNPSFTNLVSNIQTPSPKKNLEGSSENRIFYLQDGEDDQYSSCTSNNDETDFGGRISTGEEGEEDPTTVFAQDSNDEVNLTITRATVSLMAQMKNSMRAKERSSLSSLPSSVSSTEYQSFHSSPTQELGQKCIIN